MRSIRRKARVLADIPLSPKTIVIAACLAASSATAMVMSSVAGAGPEFGRHPDEAGHFITGTLIHDYLKSGCPAAPLSYALGYYARFPKVAFGHWPPAFHVSQAVWYGGFGVSRSSAMLLMAAFSAGYLFLLSTTLARATSWVASAAAMAMVGCSPQFLRSSTLLMADLPVALVALGAIRCYANYLRTGGLGWSIGFGLLSAAAILTKQEGLALAAVPPVSWLLLRRYDLAVSRRTYAPALIVIVLCIPYYLLMGKLSFTGYEGAGPGGPLSKLMILAGGLSFGGVVGVMIAVAGGTVVVVEIVCRRHGAALAASLVGLAVGLAALHVTSPAPFELRYTTGILALAALLAASAFRALIEAAGRAGIVAVVGLVALGVAARPPGPPVAIAGYQSLVGSILGADDAGAVLIASDTRGDGAIVSEFRLQGAGADEPVCRADKVLASATWMGQGYRLRFDDPAAIGDYLLRHPVRRIVIDDWGVGCGEHWTLLNRLVESRPESYPLVGSFPIERGSNGRSSVKSARVFLVEGTGGLAPPAVPSDLSDVVGIADGGRGGVAGP